MNRCLVLLVVLSSAVSAGVCQIVAPSRYVKPDDSLITGSILHKKNRDPYVVNVKQQLLYGDKWINSSFALLHLNASLDTLTIHAPDILKIIKIGPNYYQFVRSGVEWQLKFLYRIPVVY